MSDSQLEDRAACIALAQAFSYHVDRRDTEAVVALFAENGEFRRPGLHVRGHAEIRNWMTNREEWPRTRHVATPVVVTDMQADTAAGLSYFTLYQADKPEEGLPILQGPSAIAEYHDEYRRTEQGWRIERRRVFVAMIAAR